MTTRNKRLRVLVCPLDWGIGHATRCVPVIHSFLELGYEVVIAADRRPLAFLRREFPVLEWIRYPGTPIHYPTTAPMIRMMISQGPRFLHGIGKEHRALQKIIREHHIDLVFSDNRYGAWSKKIPSVFMTHQLEIQLPRWLASLTPLVRKINYSVIRKYRECWIPDFPNHHGLAGSLSHPPVMPPNTFYVGPLSRFGDAGKQTNGTGMQANAGPVILPASEESIPPFEILILLSGPEPQRTILEEKLIRQVRQTTIQVVLVRGLTEKTGPPVTDDNLRVYSHMETPLLKTYMEKTLVVICRSGYSSIMDITAVGKRAIFIPTPGQTEQEYLARYLMKKKIFFSMAQQDFDLIYALNLSINYPGMVLRNDLKELKERMKEVNGLTG